ncbi:MAG: class I SAM-dependent methyltransferase [Desulfomonilaceae bacterium]
MAEAQIHEPDYGNWVSTKLVCVPGLITVFLAVLSFMIPLLLGFALLAFLCSAYFAYARYRFSPKGGNIQARIISLALSYLRWDGKGKAIDIGCGNGPLTIGLAKDYPDARITGIDYWGAAWEYSKDLCERNAQLEGVSQRVTFQRASASKLPFDDETFDLAVSNLVFHEVKDTRDKREVIKEALRVVKKGGRFVFQDLFLLRRLYGEVDDLLETIRSWGIGEVEFVNTSNSEFIPKPLKLPFMVGRIGILHGKKKSELFS